MTSPAVRVRVPASTANLGSGFDALGMALALYDTIEVRATASGLAVSVEGEGAQDVARDESNLVVRAMRAAFDLIGHVPDGLDLRCANVIPHARGLGSSSAAIVAGIAAAYGLAGRPLVSDELDDALHLAAALEGHADNVAAAMLGGLVVAWCDGGRFHATRVEPHVDIQPVVLIPTERSATHVTRGLLPDKVPHADAAFAAGRAALAVQAISLRTDLLVPALDDRLHQDYRESAWPRTIQTVRDLRDNGVAAAVSGAGPTVLALTTDGLLPDAVDVTGFRVLPLAIDRLGVHVEPLV